MIKNTKFNFDGGILLGIIFIFIGIIIAAYIIIKVIQSIGNLILVTISSIGAILISIAVIGILLLILATLGPILLKIVLSIGLAIIKVLFSIVGKGMSIILFGIAIFAIWKYCPNLLGKIKEKIEKTLSSKFES